MVPDIKEAGRKPRFFISRVISRSFCVAFLLHLIALYGAKNVEKGKLVVVAMIGTIMNDGSFINKGELKGYESFGMLCSKRELNIPTEEVRGLYLLDPNEYNVGDLFMVN